MKFDYDKDFVFENDYARLSPLRATYNKALSQISKDTVIWKYLMEDGMSQKSLDNYLNQAMQERERGVAYPFVVFDKTTQEIAGTTRLYEFNAVLGNVKIGHTWYGKKSRGRGLNKSVKYLLFEFLFDQLGVARIGFGVHEKNRRSIAALVKMGISREGALRKFLPNTLDGAGSQRFDIILFSLLKGEWDRNVREMLRLAITKSG